MKSLSGIFVGVCFFVSVMSLSTAYAERDYTIKLKSGEFEPLSGSSQSTASLAQAQTPSVAGKHIFLQFNNPLTQSDKDQLKAKGIELLTYIPNYTWVAKVKNDLRASDLTENDIRWMGQISSEQKKSALISDGIRSFARRGGDKVQFVIVLNKDEDANIWANQFKTQYSAEIIGIEPTTNAIDLIMPESAIQPIVELDAVLWVETAKPEPVELNNSSIVNIGASTVQAAPYNLNGSGVKVAEWDGGRAYGAHQDLTGRVTELDAAAYSDHSTHVAGTILGTGARQSGKYKGMAPAATLFSQQWWYTASEAFTEYSYVIGQGAVISSNSWGYGTDTATESYCQSVMGNYFSEDATLDNLVRGDAGGPINIVWSGGNDRGHSIGYCGYLGWEYNTADGLSSSKNVIAVGAINSNNNTMTSFSSWGPTDDGRVKPDVVGPGCQSSDDYGVTSCNKSGTYSTMCGTSMAAPAVAGVVALMVQQRTLKIGTAALPSTIKGVLVNSAIDLGNTGPDYSFGHGKVDAVAACKKIGIGEPSYAEGEISTSETNQYFLNVPTGTTKLKVSLVWSDPGGTAMAGKDLINDLDLVLIDPSNGQNYPWILNPVNPSVAATKGANHRDNVETAEVTNPTAGTWRAQVIGYDIPQGPQNYSIVFSPDSINIPNQQYSWTVVGDEDETISPGQTVTVGFWVRNISNADSAQVTISDTRNWMGGTFDTTVHLGENDSIRFVRSVLIPAGTPANTADTLTCYTESKSDPEVSNQDQIIVTASLLYAIELAPPTIDSVSAPDTVDIPITVTNSGNIANNFTITLSNSLSWSSTPISRSVVLGVGASGQVTFSLIVPRTALHLTANELTFLGSGIGGAKDTLKHTITVNRPYYWGVNGGNDQTITPGQAVNIGFWIHNISLADSAHVTISDNLNWMGGTFDTTVNVNGNDSIQINRSILVPEGTVANVIDNVTCYAESKSNPGISSQDQVNVTAGPLYSIDLTEPIVDSVGAPDTVEISVTVTNSGNITDNISVAFSNTLSWASSPASNSINLALGASGIVTFSLYVPETALHLTANELTFIGSGSGLVKDTMKHTVTVSRPYLCGDVDMNYALPDISDLSTLIAFLNGDIPTTPPVQTSSFDCDTLIDISDLSILVAYLTGEFVTLCCPK